MPKSKNNRLYKDLIWYFTGSIIPFFIAFIKSPVLTRHYSPEQFGNYTLVTVTYSILCLALYTSISGCIWRFYNPFKIKNRLNDFYGILVLFYAFSTIILGLFSILWFLASKNAAFNNLILISFVFFVSNEILMIFMIILRLEGKSGGYTVFNSARLILTFLVLLYLAFPLAMDISSLIWSAIFINVPMILFLFIYSLRKIKISFNFKTKELQEVGRYGVISIAIKLGLVLLVSSDRYFIKLFDTIDNVGIYNQIYNIGQISIDSLVIIFFSSISPVLNNVLTVNLHGSNKLIRVHLKIFYQYFIPLLVYLILYYKEIAAVLVGHEFQPGRSILPYIFASAFIVGLLNFYELRLKFENRMKILLLGVVFSLAINALLNYLLIPIYGYKIAACTTLISYIIILLIYASRVSFEYYSSKSNVRHLMLISSVLLIQVAAHFIIRKYLITDVNILYSVAEGFVFVLFYAAFIYRNYKIRKQSRIISSAI